MKIPDKILSFIMKTNTDSIELIFIGLVIFVWIFGIGIGVLLDPYFPLGSIIITKIIIILGQFIGGWLGVILFHRGSKPGLLPFRVSESTWGKIQGIGAIIFFWGAGLLMLIAFIFEF